MGVAEKVHGELGVSETATSVLEYVAELLQVSPKKAARSMLDRTNFAPRWQRRYVHPGAELRRDLEVQVRAREDRRVHSRWQARYPAKTGVYKIGC